MESNNGKTVKLTGNTLSFLEEYRNYIISISSSDNFKKYYSEMSYDKIIREALMEALAIRGARSI